jgi:hypothetical protein
MNPVILTPDDGITYVVLYVTALYILLNSILMPFVMAYVSGIQNVFRGTLGFSGRLLRCYAKHF